MAYRRDYLHRDGRPPPPPYSKHKPNIGATFSTASSSIPGDSRFTPEVFKDMSKKIVQLTKVICSLTNKVEDQELLLQSEKSQYEEKILKIQSETKQQVLEYQNKIRKLEGQLEEERRSRLKKEEELHIFKQLYKISDNCQSLKQPLKLTSWVETPTNGETCFDELERFRRELSAERNLVNLYLNPRLSLQRPDSLQNGSSEFSFIGSKLRDVQNRQEDFRSLLSDCEILHSEKEILQKKYEFPFRNREEKAQEVWERERIFSMATKVNKCLTDKALKEQLDKQELQFRKRMAEVLQHLAQSESRCEKYMKEIKHSEQLLSTRDKELCETKEELRRVLSDLKLSQDTFDNTQRFCTRQSEEIRIKTDQITKLVEEKRISESELLAAKSAEQSLEKRLNDSEKEAEKLYQTLTNKVTKEEEKFTTHQREFESKLNTLKDINEKERHQLELSFNEKIDSLILSLQHKENVMSAQMEESKRCYELQLEEERKIHGDIQDNLEQQLNLLHWNVQQTIRSESEKVNNLQFLLEEKETLLKKTEKQLEELKNTEENLWEGLKQKEKLLYDPNSTELKTVNQNISSIDPKNVRDSQTTEMPDFGALKPDILNAFKYLSEKIRKLEEDKREISKEKEEMRKIHHLEIEAQSEAHKTDLERLKLSLEKSLEEKRQLKNVSDENTGETIDIEKEKVRDVQQQNDILKAEVIEIKTKYRDLQEEIKKKDQNSSTKEGLLQHDLNTTQNQLQCLTSLVQTLKSEQDKIITELEKKMNELLRVREEASQQIKNLETYWQARLVRELKKAAHSFENEKQRLTSHFDKKLRLLKDKIILLQKTIKDLQDYNSMKKCTNESNQDIQELQKIIADKDSTIYKLKEEKKSLQAELLHHKIDNIKTTSSVNNLEAIFSLKKPRLERPPLTPQLVRRHSLMGPTEQKWQRARSQSPLRGIQPEIPSISKPSLSKVQTHQASWPGEMISGLVKSSEQFSELLESKAKCKEQEKNFSPDTNAASLKDPQIDKIQIENATPEHENFKIYDKQLPQESNSSYACDTISECDEILMFVDDNEKQKSNIN